MHGYYKPLVDKTPNTSILHCGTNNLRSNKSDTDVYRDCKTSQINRLKQQQGFRVRANNERRYFEDKRKKTNCILPGICQEEYVMCLEHENIDPRKQLNCGKLHLNGYSDSILASTVLEYDSVITTLKNIRLKDHNSLLIGYLNINSITNKLEFLEPMILETIDSVVRGETSMLSLGEGGVLQVLALRKLHL